MLQSYSVNISSLISSTASWISLLADCPNLSTVVHQWADHIVPFLSDPLFWTLYWSCTLPRSRPWSPPAVCHIISHLLSALVSLSDWWYFICVPSFLHKWECDCHLLLVANMMHTSCHDTGLYGAPYSLLAVFHCKICASIVFHSSRCTFCIQAWICPNPLCQRWCFNFPLVLVVV